MFSKYFFNLHDTVIVNSSSDTLIAYDSLNATFIEIRVLNKNLIRPVRFRHDLDLCEILAQYWAPNFVYLCESGVTLFKMYFNTILGGSRLVYEKFLMVICQIESI